MAITFRAIRMAVGILLMVLVVVLPKLISSASRSRDRRTGGVELSLPGPLAVRSYVLMQSAHAISSRL
jgi:uncharacterized membrane protein